jgi:phosphate transport system protein
MPAELRTRFHQQLNEIDDQVLRLFALVSESVAAANHSLLAADTDAARRVSRSDEVVDRLELELEELTERQLLTQSPMSGDMRYLVTVLRVVPQLERCADLAEHVARRGLTGLADRVPPEVRALLSDMAATCEGMWQDAARAWAERDPDATTRIDAVDDEMNRLHDELTALLLTADVERADLMQATLVGRFYERLGDHAVHVTERIGYIVAGRRRTHGAPTET